MCGKVLSRLLLETHGSNVRVNGHKLDLIQGRFLWVCWFLFNLKNGQTLEQGSDEGMSGCLTGQGPVQPDLASARWLLKIPSNLSCPVFL